MTEFEKLCMIWWCAVGAPGLDKAYRDGVDFVRAVEELTK